MTLNNTTSKKSAVNDKYKQERRKVTSKSQQNTNNEKKLPKPELNVKSRSLRQRRGRRGTQSPSKDRGRNRSPPRRHCLTNGSNPSSPSALQVQKDLLTPWMKGGKIMRAPSKPKLTVPRNWTTMSGRFRPSESGWGFDARSTFGMVTTGISVVSGKIGSFASGIAPRPGKGDGVGGNNDRNKIKDEIEDQELQAIFYEDLKNKGIREVILIDSEWETRSTLSAVSLSDTSYILDLAQQKQFRDQERHEEALEEAFILYKAAIADGAVDDEQMFFMLLGEVKQELEIKYAEKDQIHDNMLEAALESEIERREKEQQRMRRNVFEDKCDVDAGKSATKIDVLIAEEELYLEVRGNEMVYKEKPEDGKRKTKKEHPTSSVQLEYHRSNVTPSKVEKGAMATKNSSAFFSCCGKDIEDSVVVNSPSITEAENKSMQRDPSFFQRLRKKQREEDEKQKRQYELSDDDKWWQNKVKVSVPEIEDDIPSKSFTLKSNESSNKSGVSDGEEHGRPRNKITSQTCSSSIDSSIAEGIISTGCRKEKTSQKLHASSDFERSPPKRRKSDPPLPQSKLQKAKKKLSSKDDLAQRQRKRGCSLDPSGTTTLNKVHAKKKNSKSHVGLANSEEQANDKQRSKSKRRKNQEQQIETESSKQTQDYRNKSFHSPSTTKKDSVEK